MLNMTTNVRSDMIDFPETISPNYKSSNVYTTKVFPIQPAINAAGQLQGNLEFLWTCPNSYRQDMSKSYIIFDTRIARANGTAVITATPNFNLCSTFFSTGRFELNDVLVSSSQSVPQDDTVFKRITKSYAKYTSLDSTSLMYGSDNQRFGAVQTVLTHRLAWKPEVLMANEQVIPMNVKCHLVLASNPNINVAANSPCFSSFTELAADGLVTFTSIYMVNTYVKIETPTPKTVFVPAYTIRSAYQPVAATANNLQFTVPKDTYKIVVGLQSAAATVLAGAQTTKFTSGDWIVNVLTQNAYSSLLTGLQLSYGGQVYPNTKYNLIETATRTGSVDAYLDYLGATDAQFDPSGSESYSQWSDPVGINDVKFGRVFCFNIINPPNNENTTAELTVDFSAAPAAGTTRVWIFSIAKNSWSITYGDNQTISEVKAIPYN